jgi:hypothetical protein
MGAAPPGVGQAGPTAAAPPLASPGPVAGARSVLLRYRERARVLVRGPVTGRHYEFAVQQAACAVDWRDAEALLNTRRFVAA